MGSRGLLVVISVLGLLAPGRVRAGGLTAGCVVNHALDRVEIAIDVHNDTGAAVTEVTAAPLQVTASRGATLMVMTAPHPWRELLRSKSVTFKWKARVDGVGSIVVRTEITATDAGGAVLTTGPVICAPVILGWQRPTPTPTATPTPAAVRPAASPTRRPTRAATVQRNPAPLRTNTPIPCRARGGLAARCWIEQRNGYATIFVRAENGTRSSLTNVTAALDAARTPTAELRLSTGPKSRRELICNNGVTFKWRARVRGSGSISPTAAVSAFDSQGGHLALNHLTCGSLAPPTRLGATPTHAPAPPREVEILLRPLDRIIRQGDTQKIKVKLSRRDARGDLTVTIEQRDGTLVKKIGFHEGAEDGQEFEDTWDGTTTENKLADPGNYVVRAEWDLGPKDKPIQERQIIEADPVDIRVTKPECPDSVKVDLANVKTLDSVDLADASARDGSQTLGTFGGANVLIRVEPDRQNWDGTLIDETVSPTKSNTCNPKAEAFTDKAELAAAEKAAQELASICDQKSKFIVGEGLGRLGGDNFPATRNAFWDSNILVTSKDFLTIMKLRDQGCELKCKQELFCKGTLKGEGSIVLTLKIATRNPGKPNEGPFTLVIVTR
ncbi:MAG: hypothetical protein HYR72_19930 [Deltaproteobacteria bacterium]|nr:hypothetical protein [Deltaproteobacteria bacterium]MBI3390853.1 hypothetical protein [Deltaproteobacteria bacterium]